MNDLKKPSNELSRGKAIAGCFLAVALLILAQSLALFISLPLPALGLPGAVCNVVAGLLYAAFALTGAVLLAARFLRLSPAGLRLAFRRPEPIWLLSALLLPALVLLVYTILGGKWTATYLEARVKASLVAGAVAYYGLAAGLTEELMFRGIIMGCLERAFNMKLAVILPSVLFGALHLIVGGLSIIGAIQLLIAGSLVGILFSLITLESGSIWSAALVHGLWNMVFAGGLVHVGNSAEGDAVFNLTINSSSMLLTGGDFGVEASLVSILAYAVFSLLAYWLLRKKGQIKNR